MCFREEEGKKKSWTIYYVEQLISFKRFMLQSLQEYIACLLPCLPADKMTGIADKINEEAPIV